jgi:hypothetical protein
MSDWQSIRGDASSLPTDPRNEIFEPMGLTVVVALMYLGAAINFLWGLDLIVHAGRMSSLTFRVTGPAGSGQGYWLFMGALTIVVGFIYVAIARGLKRGDPNYRQLAQIFAIIDIVFGVLAFPGGIFQIVVGAWVLWLLSRPSLRKWFDIPRDHGYKYTSRV